MTIVIDTSTSAITIDSTEHRLVTSNGVITGLTAVSYSSGVDVYSMTVMGVVSGASSGVRMGENDILMIASGGVVEARDSTSSDGVYVNGENARITVAGSLYGEDIGIIGEVGSDNLEVLVETGGTITGGGDGAGSGNGYSATLAIFGENSVVTNHGMVVAELNQDTGERVAFTNATYDGSYPDFFNPNDAFQATFVNGGIVIGDLRFQAGDDVYRGIADGLVDGTLSMGAGADRMIGGSHTENANGGAGADILNGRGGEDLLTGGGGNDVIRGGLNDDTINGGDGADKTFGGYGDDNIVAGRGADVINGGHGDDTIKGGQGLDTFVFKPGFGADTIKDFAGSNNEKIDLSDVRSIRNFTDLANNHLSQDGADAVINAGNGNIIVLEGFNSGALNAADFIF